jgi:hypothetical protein
MKKVTFRTKDGRIVSFTPGKRKATKNRKSKKNPTRKIKRLKNVTKKGRRRAAQGNGSMTNVILGGAVAGLVADMIPYGNVGKLAVGYVAGKKGGILGSTGKAIAVIGAANFTRQNLGGMVSAPGLPQLTTTAAGGDTW